MKLEEFTKYPKDINKEELESYILSVLEDMNNIVDAAHLRIDKESNATEDRTQYL